MNIARLPRFFLGALVLFSAGCTGIPADALRLGPDSAVNRDIQTRAFRADKESEMLTASAGVLQDLGFTLDESETKLGVIVASKERTAVNGYEVAGEILWKLVSFGGSNFNYAKRQVIRASLVLRPAAPGAALEQTVRVTFQRRVYDNHQRIVGSEQLNDPRLYQEFYARLAKSVFLETSLP